MNYYDENHSSLTAEASNAFINFDYPAFLAELMSNISGVQQIPFVDMSIFSNAFNQEDPPVANPLTFSNEPEVYSGSTDAVDTSVFDPVRHQAAYYRQSTESSSMPSITQGSTNSSPSVFAASAPVHQKEMSILGDTTSGATAPQQNYFVTSSFPYTQSGSLLHNGVHPYHAPVNRAWMANGTSPEAFSGVLPLSRNVPYPQSSGIDPHFTQQQPPAAFSTEKVTNDRSVQSGYQQLEPILNTGYQSAHHYPLGASSSVHSHEGLVIPGLLLQMHKSDHYRLNNIAQGNQDLKGLHPQSLIDRKHKQHRPSHPSGILRWREPIVSKDGLHTKLTKADKEGSVQGSSRRIVGPIRARRVRIGINDPTKSLRPPTPALTPSRITRDTSVHGHGGEQTDGKRRRKGRPKACDRQAMIVEKWRCKCCNQGYASQRGFDYHYHFKFKVRCPVYQKILKLGPKCAYCEKHIDGFIYGSVNREVINRHAASCEEILKLIEKYGIVSKKYADLI